MELGCEKNRLESCGYLCIQQFVISCEALRDLGFSNKQVLALFLLEFVV